MKHKLLYILFGLIILEIFINGIMTFINLVLLGIVLSILAKKDQTGEYPVWKLFLGISITLCAIIAGFFLKTI